MHLQHNLDSIPIDLFNEIFSRLPTKSVGRCRCVSKILASRLGSEDFKQLFLTRSLLRPRLLFVVRLQNHEWAFFASPQPQNPYENIVLTADFHTKFPKFSRDEFMYTSGLLYYPGVEISTNKNEERVICNPSTGKYVILPKLKTKTEFVSILGFDPIEKQFKVLLMNSRMNDKWVNILTLGSGKMRWRTIQCPLITPYRFTDYVGIERVCINGVLYYFAQQDAGFVIVCFDVRNETFKLIDIEFMSQSHRLINHKGKLVMAYFEEVYYGEVLHKWVLEDVEKHEWSKYVYTLPKKIQVLIGSSHHVYVVGMTSTGEIVLSTLYKSFRMLKLSDVYYFNPESNSLQIVKVQGFEELPHGKVHVFMDHVEDLNVYDRKELKGNAYTHLREGRTTFENVNTFEALCLSDEDDD